MDNTGRPAFQRVADDLRTQIKTGALAVGDQLPSMAQLMALYGVSNTVVRAAINHLRLEGFVVGQQGKGVFVRDQAEPGDADSVEFDALMQQLKAMREDLAKVNDRLARVEELTSQLPEAAPRD